MVGIEKLQKRLLRYTATLLERNGISYWLESGTLIGLIREKNLPAWHRNIDIGIDEKNLDRFLALRKKFSPLYKFREVQNHSGREWIDSDITRVKVYKIWENNNNAVLKIMISIKYKHGHTYRWVDRRSCKSVSSHFFDRLDKINFFDKDYPIPSDVENYLRQRYGDWKTHKYPWFARIEDLSIIDDDIIKTISHKKILRPKTKKRIKLHDHYLDRMKRMLFDSLDIFEKYSIKYWIDDGTLLGIIRDGDLIPWDHDVDVGISGESASKIISIWYKFFPKYIIRKRSKNNIWLPGKIRSIIIETPWEKLLKINFHIDLFVKYKADRFYRWIDSGALKHIDRKFYDNLDSITWEGRKISIPSHIEEYLSIRYGNWRIPDRNFDPSLDDGTIAERGF